jgi:hypothetical protein
MVPQFVGPAPSPPTLRSITVSPSEMAIEVGQRRQLVATGGYSDEATRGITTSVIWASSDERTAIVDSAGLITALTSGLVTVTASLQEQQGNAAIEVALPLDSGDVVTECIRKADFRFDQIVLDGLILGQVTWDQIANGRVREGLTKTEELGSLATANADGSPFHRLAAGGYLAERQRDGFLIAMMETFGWTVTDPFTSTLAKHVNSVFRDAIGSAGAPPARVFDWELEEFSSWVAYYGSSSIPRDSTRINIFFVRPSESCD